MRVEGPALFNVQPSAVYLKYNEDQGPFELALRLPLQPEIRLPGTYQVTPRLSFWNDNCAAIRCGSLPQLATTRYRIPRLLPSASPPLPPLLPSPLTPLEASSHSCAPDCLRMPRACAEKSDNPGFVMAGTFLGTFEGRCPPRGNCSLPRFVKACDEKSKLALSPVIVTIHAPPPGSAQGPNERRLVAPHSTGAEQQHLRRLGVARGFLATIKCCKTV